MTKQELEQLRKLKLEAKQLQDELDNLPFVPSSVKGSMPEFPYIEQHYKVFGVDKEKGKKVQEKLDAVLDKIRDRILAMEEWLETVNDAEMRTILRYYYRNGLTQAEIAEELAKEPGRSKYSEKTVQRKIKKFFQNVL